jgi:hypothetical protein
MLYEHPPPPQKKRQDQDRVVIIELKPRYGVLFAQRRSEFDKKKFHLGFMVGQVALEHICLAGRNFSMLCITLPVPHTHISST